MVRKKKKVTPYEVSGKINYDKLIKEFGVSKIDQKILDKIQKHTSELHPMIRRGLVFAHRDLNWVLDEYEKGKKFFLYTGRAPSGPLHLGHLIPWIFVKWLQDKFDVELWFHFPDEEKFLVKQDTSFEDTQKYLKENMMDIIALGFDPKKTYFIVDTEHAGIMYREACKVAKKITFNMVKASFGFTDQTNVGAIFYTSMQAVPSFLPSVLRNKQIPCLIPHGIDQDPHFRITRDILPRIGHLKPASIQWSFLPPLQGVEGKMGSSGEENTAIFTTDDSKTVEKKINKYAFSGGQSTLEKHRKKGGNPDIDVSFQYLKMFFEEDDKRLDEIEAMYRKGEMTTGDLKKILIDKINKFLKEHQKKRKEAEYKINDFLYKF
jgi:tryptophanyl-tRNA synthetase